MRIRAHQAFILLMVAVILLLDTGVYAEQLIIPGTGSNEILLKELASAFNEENPEHEVIIPSSVGSSGGVMLVGTGINKLGRVSRYFKEEEFKYRLNRLVFARDMIVFVVGHKVGVTDLSSQQLAELFSGRIENWKQVGGNDQRVRLLIREPGDSSMSVIRQNIKIFDELVFSDKAKVLYHDYDMVNSINKYSTAIGWLTNSTMKAVDPSVKAISVNGVEPTQENAYDGRYNLIGDHALVFKPGTLDGLAKKFVDFVFSRKGNKILINNGVLPVNQERY